MDPSRPQVSWNTASSVGSCSSFQTFQALQSPEGRERKINTCRSCSWGSCSDHLLRLSAQQILSTHAFSQKGRGQRGPKVMPRLSVLLSPVLYNGTLNAAKYTGLYTKRNFHDWSQPLFPLVQATLACAVIPALSLCPSNGWVQPSFRLQTKTTAPPFCA